MRYKDFKQLSMNLSQNKEHTPEHEADSRQERNQEDEEQVFQQAMQDVQPLKDKGRGRKVVLSQPPSKGYQPEDASKSKQNAREYLLDLIQGKVDFEIDYSDEYLLGNVRGLDPKILRKLKTGELSPEAHLDLHGLNLDQARATLLSFIRDNYLNSKRCLLIIPGRGKNSPQGRSIIREHIQPWLTQDPLKRVILAFTTARPLHGGTGALYVLLRKFKKSKGKIFWQRWEQDML